MQFAGVSPDAYLPGRTGHYLHQYTLIRLSHWDMRLWANPGGGNECTLSLTQCGQSLTLIDQVNNKGRTG